MLQQTRSPARSIETDRSISARLRARDGDAFYELYQQDGAWLVTLMNQLLGDRAMAEDVVQDVFTTLWSRPDIYEPDRGSLRSWLNMRCRGRAIDQIRAGVARDRRERFVQIGELSCHHDDHDAHERQQILERAVEALSPDDQALLQLAFFAHLSYRAAAELLGIPEGTAKSRLRRILSTLRRRLAAAQEQTGPTRPENRGGRNW